MARSDSEVAAPNFRRLMREALAPLELARYWMEAGRLQDLPEGDGHAVMLVPGFGFGEEVLKPLMRAVQDLGYAAHGWGEGRNLGLRPQIQRRLASRLQDLKRRHRAKVSLIGWSLGGVVVRELARSQPELVSRVITLGCPINGYEFADNLLAQTTLALKRALLGSGGVRPSNPPPPVPCTSIFSRTDGFVDWRASIEDPAPNVENVEVHSSHIGLLYNPEVVRVIAGRLARTRKAGRRARTENHSTA